MLLTELVCIFIVVTSTDPELTIFNFVALNVITDFDNFCFDSLQSEILKKLLEKEGLLKIRRTTSVYCDPKVLIYD